MNRLKKSTNDQNYKYYHHRFQMHLRYYSQSLSVDTTSSFTAASTFKSSLLYKADQALGRQTSILECIHTNYNNPFQISLLVLKYPNASYRKVALDLTKSANQLLTAEGVFSPNLIRIKCLLQLGNSAIRSN